MLRELLATALACALGFAILGCQTDQNGNPTNNDTSSDQIATSGHSGMSSGSGWNQGSSNRETSGGAVNNAGSLSKEAPSTRPY
jgi:hypothetical protein